MSEPTPDELEQESRAMPDAPAAASDDPEVATSVDEAAANPDRSTGADVADLIEQGQPVPDDEDEYR